MNFDVKQLDIEELKAVVKTAAKEELMPGFGAREFTYKEDGSVITKADIAMQARLESQLGELCADCGFVGEEMTEQQQQAVVGSGEPYWCIDPLDGTNNYAAGLPLFAVSIAIVAKGEAVLGLIYDPVRDEMFTAIKGEGAWLNGEQLILQKQTHHAHNIIAEIEMKRLPEDLVVRLVTEQPFGSHRNSGSSAIDWCWLSAGRFDAYLHGGQKLWDYAAGHLIYHETGGGSISLDGEPVFRGRLEGRSVLAVPDEKLFKEWYDWIGIPILL
jgi:myo-inositol-1(or 4)-monophosphatase